MLKGKKKQSVETLSKGAQMLELADKNIKAAIIDMFRKQSFKKLKGSMMAMTQQRENINKNRHYFLKRTKWELWS